MITSDDNRKQPPQHWRRQKVGYEVEAAGREEKSDFIQRALILRIWFRKDSLFHDANFVNCSKIFPVEVVEHFLTKCA